MNSAQAAAPATSAIDPAASYRDLLEPIPNALALLKNEDTQGTEARTDGQTRLAQHHHHHHHRYYRRYHITIITTATITTTTEIEKFRG